MTHIEWTGRNYEDQIDSLSEALEAAENHINDHGYDDETVMEAELIFAKIAFANWHTEPDNWSLSFS